MERGAAGVTLVATIHDPDDSQLAQARRVLPALQDTYAKLVILASDTTSERSSAELRAAGALVERARPTSALIDVLGNTRRDALALGLRHSPGHIHFCDWDRAIHWAEFYPEELREVMAAIPSYDFLILGRTPRAFASHPRMQRDTEAIINHCFGLAWGQELDVTAASRGLSRRAAELIVAECDEPTIGNDCAWPLFLARHPGVVIGYAATEGLEWETPDRLGDEIAAMGSLDTWLAHHDADVAHWAFRLRLAAAEVEAVQRWRQS